MIYDYTPKLCVLLMATLAGTLLSATANAQHQTTSFTSLQPASAVPYRIELEEIDYSAIDLPTLHSFAVGQFDNKWLFLSGRTNGLHGFDDAVNFPVQYQNRDVWVVDFENHQSWVKPLDDPTSGLTEGQILSLANTNNQFYQRDETLYITGGYGVFEDGIEFGTFDYLSAIDLPGLGSWVMNGTGSATENIRQIQDDVFRVTGGGMHEIDGKTHLVFGQDFIGEYTPGADGDYTYQVRTFEIVDDGVNLAVENVSASPMVADYRRRDLNVVPILRPDGLGGLEEKLVALSGVFTARFGAWTVPVEVDADGQPTQANPTAEETFKQGFNGYHSSKVGLFSESSGNMYEVLFGGISAQYLDETTGQVVNDNFLPFVNDITAIQIDPSGNYSQHHMGYFPELLDQTGQRLRFGANSEFLLSDDVPLFENGVIDFDQLAHGDVLGLIFGGIVTNGPHTRQGASSSGSNHVFAVRIVLVPEPSTFLLLAPLAGVGMICRLRSQV